MNIVKLFENFEIRFVPDPIRPNGFGIVAIDLATVLGIQRTNDIASVVDDKWKGTAIIRTPGGNQEVVVIWEPGVYEVLAKSRKPQAKPFKDWLFESVLPSIRQTGSYSIDSIPSIKPDYAAIKEEYSLASFLITDTFAGVGLKSELVAGLKLNAAIAITPSMAPVLEESRQLLIASTAQEFELLTATEIGKRLDGLSARKVNQMLIEKGLQIKNPNKKSSKDPSYVPTPHGSEFSDLTLATGSNNSGTFQQLRWYSSVLTQLM